MSEGEDQSDNDEEYEEYDGDRFFDEPDFEEGDI